MALDDILNAFLGGGVPQKGQAPASNDPLAEMLQGILGGGMGGATASPGMGAGTSDPLGGLLESILGGMAGQGDTSGGMAGMGGTTGMNSLLAPVADALAKKLGLPPEVAMMVVSFLGAKLMSGASGQAGTTSGTKQGRSGQASRGRSASPQALDLDSLLETMGNDKGMAQELAKQTGLDPATAERSLQEAIGMIGGTSQEARRLRPSNRPSGGSLDSLLDSW